MEVPSDADLSKAVAPEASAQAAQNAPAQASAPAPQAEDQGPVAQLLAGDKPPKARHHGHGGYGPVPKIPAHALQKNSTMLNRFYFVRKGDTAKSVAKLLYGNAAQAKDLKAWNKGAWSPGRILYYNSPMQPQDDQMRSFFQERNVQADDYLTQVGDRIGRIAAKKLGSPSSWKEIAVVNGMESATAFSPGQKLAIYPKDLTPYAFTNESARIAEAAPVPPPPTAAPVGRGTAPVSAPGAAGAAGSGIDGVQGTGGETVPPPNVAPPTQVPTPEAAAQTNPFVKKSKKSSGLDPAKLLEQNLPFIVLAGGVVALLVLLLMVNRRRRSAGEDLGGEEGFSPRAGRR
jgi:hypothetical protein